MSPERKIFKLFTYWPETIKILQFGGKSSKFQCYMLMVSCCGFSVEFRWQKMRFMKIGD